MSRTLSAVSTNGKQAASVTGPRFRWHLTLLLGLGFKIFGDGPGVLAQTAPLMPSRPSGLAFDTAGDLFFSDAGRHCVYEVSLAGVLSVVAGTGVQGFGGDEGAASAAQLNEPRGLALGADGTLYIADTGNARVRAVRGGVMHTLAGQGAAGYAGDGGAATTSRLNRPVGLSLAADGSLFIADSGNQRVRVVRSGVITTAAGNGVQGFGGDGGPATQALLSSPEQIAVSSDGRLFIAETGGARLRVMGSDGVIRTFAGTGAEGFAGDGGAAAQARLRRPGGIAVSAAGEVYFADSGNERLRKIGNDGTIGTVAGAGVEGRVTEGGAAGNAALDEPAGVAISPLGVVWFAEGRNATVRAITGDALLFQPSGLVERRSTLSAQASSGVNSPVSMFVSLAGQAGTPQGSAQVSEGGTVLGQASLAAGTATVALGVLTAGAHTFKVDYSGDVLNPAASTTFSSVVGAPAPVIASADAVTMRFGDEVPALTGTLTGLPPQETGRVQVSFTTAATSLSNVGVYPIVPVLRGVDAAGYVVQLSPVSGQVNVTPAQSIAALLTPAPSGYAGLPLTLSATVRASGKGTPTGSVTFLENGTVLATAGLVNGSGSVVLAAPSVGQHAITVRYPGDANFLASDSVPQAVAVNALPDFTLTQVTAAAPTMSPGTAATFSFQVGASPGPFTGAVAFATSGLPSGWTAYFAPANVIPGVSSATVVLTVTASGTATLRWAPAAGVMTALLLPAFVLKRRRRASALGLLPLLCVAFLVTGCGDRVASTADLVAPHPASFVVTGTATNLAGQVVTHTVVVSYLQP